MAGTASKRYRILAAFLDIHTGKRYGVQDAFFCTADDVQAARLIKAKVLAAIPDAPFTIPQAEPPAVDAVALAGDVEAISQAMEADGEPEPQAAAFTPQIEECRGGWYNVLGRDGRPINQGGKLRKKYAEKMLAAYLDGTL